MKLLAFLITSALLSIAAFAGGDLTGFSKVGEANKCAPAIRVAGCEYFSCKEGPVKQCSDGPTPKRISSVEWQEKVAALKPVGRGPASDNSTLSKINPTCTMGFRTKGSKEGSCYFTLCESGMFQRCGNEAAFHSVTAGEWNRALKELDLASHH